jgi:hypothetical protein
MVTVKTNEIAKNEGNSGIMPVPSVFISQKSGSAPAL